MTNAGVYVLKDDRTLVAMQSAEFVRESEFQALLADFPQLLAGEQMNAQDPRRFLLVARERKVASDAASEGRWFLDHLFVDQDGVPTLVEVKRQSDVRLRREVIGQLMEYAANAVAFWPPQSLRTDFEARCALQELDAGAELARHLRDGADVDAFWAAAGANLRAGRIRLLLVADLITPELRRIVEFMNAQMQPAELLAVELRQFQGEGLRALAPLVIGRTEEAVEQKRTRSAAPSWTPQAIVEALDGEARTAAQEIVRWTQTHADRVQTTASGATGPAFQHAGAWLYPFLINRQGDLTLFFDYLVDRPVYAVRERREAWAVDLAAAGLPVSTQDLDGRQVLKLAELTLASTQAFLRAMDGFKARFSASAD